MKVGMFYSIYCKQKMWKMASVTWKLTNMSLTEKCKVLNDLENEMSNKDVTT